MAKKLLSVVGQTTDDRFVLGGVFRLYDTRGIPLSIVLDAFHKQKYLPSWTQLYEDGVSSGIREGKWINMIESAIGDSVFGAKYGSEVAQRLRRYALHCLRGGENV